MAPAWSTILSEPVTDPEVLALAKPRPFAEAFFFGLGQLIRMFACDRFNFRVRGVENLPLQGPYLLCSNHQSYIDPLLLASALPWRVFRNTFAVGTSEIFGRGFMRQVARMVRIVVLDPDANLVPAMRAGAFGLNHGRVLILYPEGERTDDGNLRIFRKGAAILSIHTQAPIVPVAIEGLYEVWPRHKRFPTFGDLRMTIGKPLLPPPASETSEETYEGFTAELKQKVSAMWDELREEKSGREIVAAGEAA